MLKKRFDEEYFSRHFDIYRRLDSSVEGER